MRRLLALLFGGLGLGALLRRRRERAAASSPADDLRAKLAETRSADAGPDEPSPAAEEDVDTRRADVHARARQAMDDLS
ncbi:MAG TPA: hypothetical protein VH538_05960 [Gaiellaceae bacterium]